MGRYFEREMRWKGNYYVGKIRYIYKLKDSAGSKTRNDILRWRGILNKIRYKNYWIGGNVMLRENTPEEILWRVTICN